MSMSKSALTVLVIACVAAFICQGCELFSKLPTGPAETTEPTGEGTGERHETGTTAETTEAAWVKVTSPADNATGVDTKLPVRWWVDPAAGEVTMLGVNIFECGADGTVPSGAQAVIAYKMTYEKAPELREWTFFEKDVDKYWLFQGSYKDMEELKPNTKYMMNFVISTDAGKSRTIPVYFTTK